MALVFQEDRDRPTCPACGFIHYVDPKVAVAVVVGDADGVLLGLRGINPGKGLWSFPSGYVNRGEVLEEAAAREVLEEMQFEVRITRLIGVYSTAGDPVILVAYAGEHVAGEPHPDGHESLEVRTFPLDALPSMAFSHDPRILADWQRIVLGER
jgi:ADP-ribose pyrophosphatase YjhB (NUDIX family)